MLSQEVVNAPEIGATLMLGAGWGLILWRTRTRGAKGLWVGIAAGSSFFLLVTASRFLFYPELDQLIRLRLFTWSLFLLFMVTIIVTGMLMERWRRGKRRR